MIPGPQKMSAAMKRLTGERPVPLLVRGYGRFISWTNPDESGREPFISRAEVERLAEIAAFSPAVALLRAARRIRPVLRGGAETIDMASLVAFGLGPVRQYFGRATSQAVIRNATEAGSYVSRVLAYCRDAQFQSVIDEYLHLIAESDPDGDPLRVAAGVLRMGMGTTYINVRRANGKLTRRPKPVRAHVALAFGEDVSEDSAGRTGRQSDVAAAFNSPFWPFVLATTSVGQEGLDFHRYCGDIVHWNLPSSPVDFEQREGRSTGGTGSRSERQWLPSGLTTECRGATD